VIATSQLLTPSQLAIVRKRSNFRGVFLAVHAWAVIFGMMALVVWMPNPITFLAAVAVIGGRQLGLAILMHDGAHGVLCENSKLNAFVSQWLCAYPTMADTWAYRRYHLTHHAHTQQTEDPDLILSAPFPITRKSFRRKLIRDLTGQTGFQQRRAQILNALGKSDWPLGRRLENYWQKLGRATIAQGIIFTILALSGHWYLYFGLWLLPFLTWQQAITRIRNIAEHAMVPDNDDDFRNARTTKANWLARATLAPYWVNYHVEHHLMMWVPCYNLPRARAFLIANGFAERMESRGSFREVIALATSKPDDQDKPGSLVHNARKQRVSGITSEGFSASNDEAA